MKTGHYRPRHTYDWLRNYFKKYNYTLLTKNYVNSSEKIILRCPKKHIWKCSLSTFKSGRRCIECSGKKKFSYCEVQAYFRKKGCELISKEYINSKSKLEYVCPKGHLQKTEFRNFRGGKGCRQCGTIKAQKTNRKNHGGQLYFQTDEFKKKREKSVIKKYGVKSVAQAVSIKEKKKKTNLKKYGVEHVLQNTSIRKKIKETMLKRYGCEYSLQIPSSKKKLKQTLMKRYGVPNLAYLSRPASKQSQKLFWAIYDSFSNNTNSKTYFAELNGEFIASKGKYCFKYDFVNTKLKKAIEFNGYNFHPKTWQKPDEKNWCVFHPNKTVKEARKLEKIKYHLLESRGYTILTVWDYEYVNDFDNLVKRCKEFLLN